MSDTSQPPKVRVLIADDHDMVAEMMMMVLSTTSDLEGVVASTLDDAINLEQSDGPFDVVLLDYQMPGMNGVEGLVRMKKLRDSKPVAIITGHPSQAIVEQVMAAGSSGVIPKTTPMRSLINAIRFIEAGERYLPIELIRHHGQVAAEMSERFTAKEIQVIVLLGEGKPNKIIAAELGLAEATVKMHVKSICRKLGVSNRTQVVISARDQGIL